MLCSFENLPLIICWIIFFFPPHAQDLSIVGRLSWQRRAKGTKKGEVLHFSLQRCAICRACGGGEL